MDCLKKMDDVAYVRFASVYRQFRDARDFVSEVKNLGAR
jgi:transcriptional repressor NrdR